jgi:queuine tRNA-ribosyltransferase
MMNELILNHGRVPLPAFFPDGTYGVVRCTDATDLENCRVDGLVMNGFHLLSKPGISVLKPFGGIHRFTGWNRPILMDSGGFQVFSLIRQNAKFGEIRKNELIFRPDGGTEKIILTPEKSIQFQFTCGADVMMCLDYCTHPEDSYEICKQSVDITVNWAKRCKKEYESQLKSRKISNDKRPLLFAIIQGGGYKDLRKTCANELIGMGFDGFGFGGWPVSSDGRLIEDILSYTAELMPDDTVKYAMGLGKPDGIRKCVQMGYNLFDCVIPTREARHNRLYVFDNGNGPFDYAHYYILDEKHIRENKPISEDCDCLTCRNYTRAYLYHLYKIGDSLAYRLATLHNLRFYTKWMENLRIYNGRTV